MGHQSGMAKKTISECQLYWWEQTQIEAILNQIHQLPSLEINYNHHDGDQQLAELQANHE
jgi:hypothetical protein